MQPPASELLQRLVDPLVDLIPEAERRFVLILFEAVKPLLELGPAGMVHLAVPLEERVHIVRIAFRFPENRRIPAVDPAGRDRAVRKFGLSVDEQEY